MKHDSCSCTPNYLPVSGGVIYNITGCAIHDPDYALTRGTFVDVYDDEDVQQALGKGPRRRVTHLRLTDEYQNTVTVIVVEHDSDCAKYICRHPGQKNTFKVPTMRVAEGTAEEIWNE